MYCTVPYTVLGTVINRNYTYYCSQSVVTVATALLRRIVFALDHPVLHFWWWRVVLNAQK